MLIADYICYVLTECCKCSFNPQINSKRYYYNTHFIHSETEANTNWVKWLESDRVEAPILYTLASQAEKNVQNQINHGFWVLEDRPRRFLEHEGQSGRAFPAWEPQRSCRCHRVSQCLWGNLCYLRHVQGLVEMQITLGGPSVYSRMKSKPTGVSGPTSQWLCVPNT